jgi:hypothetical protein
MKSIERSPGWRIGSVLLVGISLSIGWGIRGNFGHEYGAEFAGCLAAISVALLSGREDWRRRVAYFAFFGALGWGFGASQSYMQVLSYTDSGHALSQGYGYAAVFFIGFMWAALGAAGTAFAAVASESRLIKFFKPLLFVFAAILIIEIIEDPVARLLQQGLSFDDRWSRHKNPLYWFDTYYLHAFFALLGVGIYDLWERKGDRNRLYLPLFATGGAIVGWGIQALLRIAGLESAVGNALTYLQGDPTYVNPATGKLAYTASNLLNNWPQWFGDYPQHIGWLVGLILGITVYFLRFGKFRNDSSLIVYIGLGWLISFLLFPVLGSIPFAKYGGLRMTPPRSDDWSGVMGVFVAVSIWMWRNKLKPVSVAALIAGIIGGIGFSGMHWIRQILTSFGNTRILQFEGIMPGTGAYNAAAETWGRWQAQNWHSFLEQSYGFVNGIAIAVAIGFLASRIKIHPEQPKMVKKLKGQWTRAFSALMVLLGLTYLNVVKNVDVWSSQLDPGVWQTVITHADGTKETIPAFWDMPYFGRLPGIHFLHFMPTGWFNLTWALLVIGCVIIVIRHYRSPLAIIPKSSLAKGQIMFLILLWIMVVANFERALTGWSPERLLTEWVIFLNAILATVLVLLLPRESEIVWVQVQANYKPLYKKLWITAVGALMISSLFFLVTNRMIYHYPAYDKLNLEQYQSRFGPKASWRTHPNLKNNEEFH